MLSARVWRFGPCGCSVVALCAALAAPQSAAAQEAKIGVASAVVPQARGARPRAEPVVLRVGQDMVVDETVVTASDGRAQLLFVDGTSLMVGPNSEVVLDRFVFDAETGRGEAAFSATRGVLRMVGGKISKTTAVTLRTPTATVGIRGGIGVVATDGQSTTATFLFGDGMTVDSGGVTKSVGRPGFTILAPGAGQPPADPQPADEQALTQQLGALEGAPGQSPGGASVSDDDVASTQISQLSDGDGSNPPAPPPAAGAQGGDTLSEANQQASLAIAAAAAMGPATGSQNDASAPGAGDAQAAACAGFCPEGVSGAALRNGAATAFSGAVFGNGRFQASTVSGAFDLFTPGAAGEFAVGGSNLPATTPFGPATGTGKLTDSGFALYKLTGSDGVRQLVFGGPPVNAVPTSGVDAFVLDEDFLRQSNLPFVDPIAGAGSGRAFVAWNDGGSGGQRAFAGGAVVIRGQGGAQRSGLYILSGAVLQDGAGRPFIRAMLEGLGRYDAQGAPTLFSGSASSADGGDGSDFFGSATARHFVLQSVGVNGSDAAVGSGVIRDVAGSQSTFDASAAAFPTAYAAAPRSTRTLNGFLSGVERMQTNGGSDYVETQSGDPTKTVISSDAARNVLAANFILDASSEEASVALGFGETEAAGRSAFIDDRTFVATANGFTYNGSPISGRGGLVTSAFLEHGGLLPAGVSFCDCDYLVWGFVGADRLRTAASAPGDRNNLGLATFVAGALSDTTQLVGLSALSATYQGHLIANVANAASGPLSYYTAVGSISLTFGFGGGNYELTGAAISNFDGVNFSGLGSSASFTGNKYSNAGLAISGVHPDAGSLDVKLEGAFFGPGSPPANTGGQALITGDGYLAAGTYGAKQTSVGPPPG